MKSKIILSTLLLCLLFSCKKKSEDVPAVQNIYCSKLIQSTLGTETWSYDAQNKPTLLTFTSVDENVNPSYNYRILKYTANGSIEEAIYDYVSPTRQDVKLVNTFNAEGKFTRVDTYNASTQTLQSYSTAIYATGSVRVNYYATAAVLSSYYLYIPTADGKNVEEIKSYSGNNVLSYSNKNSNFDTQKSFQSLYPVGYLIGAVSTNNSRTIVLSEPPNTFTYNYTFEYNADGYVTKRINATTGSVVSFEYIKR
jgi:hypothetical protein